MFMPCPHCSRQITTTAQRCKHCGWTKAYGVPRPRGKTALRVPSWYTGKRMPRPVTLILSGITGILVLLLLGISVARGIHHAAFIGLAWYRPVVVLLLSLLLAVWCAAWPERWRWVFVVVFIILAADSAQTVVARLGWR